MSFCATAEGVPRRQQWSATGPLRGECGLRPLRDEPTFFLGQGGIEVQHERVGITAEFSHDKWYALGH